MIGSKRKATRSGPHAANGMAIWKARTRKGMSQERLASQIGVGRIHVINLENGLHLPSGPTRDRLAEALDVDRGEIRSADDEEDSPLAALSTDDLVRALLQRVQTA